MTFELADTYVQLKRGQLRRMQRIATALLLTMLALLALSAAFKGDWPWLEWVQAFAAAAAVGAIADWFAVVALFHHPLGLPLPHTAIVPANKDRIGESLGHFVEHNFLTAENVLRRLDESNLTNKAAVWLSNETNSAAVALHVGAGIEELFNALGNEDVRGFIDRVLAPQLDKLDVAKIAATILTVVTRGGRHQALLDRALRVVEAWLIANGDLIRAKFSAASKYTPGFLDSYIVNKFVEGIIALLHDIMRDPSHRIRRQLDVAIADFIEKLQGSDEYRAQAEVLKREVLEHLQREDFYRAVCVDVKARLTADLSRSDSWIRSQLTQMLIKLGIALRDDTVAQAKLNARLLRAIEMLLVRHRHHMSELITDVVKRWDSHEMAEKMELEIGKDLQYIRISGTLVGGSVGLLLHAITGAM